MPLVMGATMFLQQKLTPTAVADPIQQKVFLLMPVLFTFLLYGFPSGLVLYWLTNNIVSIGQQWWIQRGARQSTPA
jgi:YidC/Oxa1 family membrane protein insertase